MKKMVAFILIPFFLTMCLATNVVANETAPRPTKLLSGAAILMDATSGQVLYDKDANVPMYPASLTKIATAIFAIENGNLGELVTVSSRARGVDGTRVYLEEGEQVTLKKLIQGLLINSGNDAGVAIAEHMSGSVEEFATELNNYLINQVGVQDTHFDNPHGLFSPTHVSTAYDIAKITQYAMNNELFRDIIATKQLEWNGQAWTTTLFHHHKMMREIPYEGITGGKTGYVDESGHTLMTTAEQNGLNLIVVTLKANQIMTGYQETMDLLDYGFDTFKTETIRKGTEFQSENGQSFHASKDIHYTAFKNEDIEQKLSNDGVLSVVVGEPLLDLTVQLAEEVEVEQVQVVPSDQTPSKDESSSSSSSFNLWYFLLFLFLIVVLLFAVKRFGARRTYSSNE